ncbi:OmpA family protein [Paracrocinitomix mangrovi]|uniref:OmpA family protein n=1 Tax=Paracrocinitomix mangrovi TaxID=2862509 RepID=UPI001C8EBDAD|nr:OmpA family protein [Paracrocinitomix mangrovi]UKN01006.1 OmpA family protein [Paracrocinitomix mangrovi]
MKLFKLFVAIAVLIGTTNTVLAQGGGPATRNYGKEADRLWQSGAYAEAAEAFKKASEKLNPKNQKARLKKAYYAYMSATCYRLLHQFSAAEQQYEKAVLLKYQEAEPKTFYYLAEMEMAQCKHDEAKENYKKYEKLNPGDELTKVRIESCEKYKEMTVKSGATKHLVTNVTKLNTEFYDYAPVMGGRGKEMYFSSSRSGSLGEEMDNITGQNYMDLWITNIDRNDNWGQPEPIGEPVNSGNSEGTMCFDGRGKTMWFTRCPVIEKTNIGCEIYMVEKKSKSWGEPVLVKLKDHDTTNVGHPCVSPDGLTLIFASNMAGGYGGLDLWYSTYDKRNDEWSLPVNLGEDINTAGNDCFPTWGPDDKLYYASNGMVGLGGLDIYRADRVGEELKWEKPKNLGYPMNSCMDDYHIIYTEKGKIERGYISSNRNGSKKGANGENSQDIWDFYLPPVLVDLDIIVKNLETGEAIPDAKVVIVGSGGENYVMNTDPSGRITMSEKPDGTRYIEPGGTWTIEVEGVPKKYFSASDNFSTEGIEVNRRIIRELKVMPEKEVIRLPEVRYDLGKATLQVNDSVNSKDSLNFLYDLMVANPTIIVQLMAHTDSRGSDAANLDLSQRRADSCVAYLVNEKGLDPARLVPKGMGETTPAMYFETNAEGDTTLRQKLTESYINGFKRDKDKFEKLHQFNRRTEGKIISYDYVPKKEEDGNNE